MFKGMFKKTTKTTKELQPQVCSVPTITELEHVLFSQDAKVIFFR